MKLKMQLNRKWILKSLLIMAMVATALAAVGGGGIYWYFSRNLPRIITIADYRPPIVTRILGNHGSEEALIGEFYKNERRYLIPYSQIPLHVVQSFISAEDDHFFQHQGINLAAILRASIANMRAGQVVQGGSTITQQVAKSLLLTSERSFVRKIKEVILAGRIESNLSKEQILYLYLNQIYLGRGAYGVEAAARIYFRKHAKDLSLAEGAILAGLPQAPGKYGPHINPKRAKERQTYVLRRMAENKFITDTQMTEAVSSPVKIWDEEDLNQKYSGYFVEHVRRYIQEKYGDQQLYEDGLTIKVPTNPQLLSAGREAVQTGLRAVDKRIGYRGPLKRLKSDAEIEEFLRTERFKVISDKLHYTLFMPDGRNDAIEAMKRADIKADEDLLIENGLYQAVITGIDDKRKVATALVGAAKVELPHEGWTWAKAAPDAKDPMVPKSEPRNPSQLFHKGDVVEVRILKNLPTGITAGLEQKPEIQGALFSIDVATGNILAMEGGSDFAASEFNRVTQAVRQPGSSFKPYIYSAAVEKGFTPATVIVDSPIVYQDSELGTWKPANFEEKFYGDTTFRQALVKSRNVPTIKILQQITIPYLLDYVKRLGLGGQFSPDLSLSLGSAGVSLFEMTKTYALFPRLGRKVDPVAFTSIVDRDGKVVEERSPQPPGNGVVPAIAVNPAPSPSPSASGAVVAEEAAQKPGQIETAKLTLPTYPLTNDPAQVLDPRVAFVMTHLMKEVVNYGTGFEAKSLGRPAAGKTGTTNDFIDAWFMGFTPQIVTGAWVGYDNVKTIGHNETGARAALPIWLQFMKEAVKDLPEADFAAPPGIVFASIDPTSGRLVPPNASNAIKEAFIEGTEPTSDDHRKAVKGPNGTPSSHQDSSGEFLKEDID